MPRSTARSLGVVATFTALVATPALACSFIPSINPMLGPRMALMLAVSTPDTVFAGPGTTIEHRSRLPDGPEVVIRGEWISRDTFGR